ncbi:unnamed protein product [Candidula unifasciata]|uniref:Uncharacterized protein n=1 Tax=Candidula unifasciata TaxID=100452 RepID=A0A8S3YWV7_9EUPU|nr:unnamed protein product [Candidula unifasciata]
MWVVLQTSLHTLMMVTLLCMMLPSTLTISVLSSFRSVESMKEDPRMADADLPLVDKREISGADPWSLCPNNMERVDCFFEYLRVYARLRKATSGSNSVSVRNIGKRSRFTSTTASDVCHDDPSSGLCLLQSLLDDLLKDDT